MSAWATYVTASGVLVSISSAQPTGLAPGLPSKVIDQTPDATHVWDASTASLVTLTERPDGQAGTFHEALTGDGWRWYYLVGPVTFEAEDGQATRHAQPTVNAAKQVSRDLRGQRELKQQHQPEGRMLGDEFLVLVPPPRPDEAAVDRPPQTAPDGRWAPRD